MSHISQLAAMVPTTIRAKQKAPKRTILRGSERCVMPKTTEVKNEKISTARYEREKRKLQIELLKLQAWVKENGEKIVILFEGRDAAVALDADLEDLLALLFSGGRLLVHGGIRGGHGGLRGLGLGRGGRRGRTRPSLRQRTAGSERPERHREQRQERLVRQNGKPQGAVGL